ncbi:MAG: transposase [Cellulosilyticum sp.]|nr:transposase [Cellulosilyticum sp.]
MVTMLLKKTYYGFKLHAMVTFDSFITNITVIPAHIDDHEALWEISSHNPQVMVLADKGYIGDKLSEMLETQSEMKLMALKRGNSKIPYPKDIRDWISKHRG